MCWWARLYEKGGGSGVVIVYLLYSYCIKMNQGQAQGNGLGHVKQSGGNNTYASRYSTQRKQRSAIRQNIAPGQTNQAELHKIMSLFQ